jgi:phage repressor protein C with HTH and peptisase S24 domain
MKNGIKKLCGQNDISVSELARRIGMQPPTLRRYTRMREDGSQEAQPSIELATKIAKALDVSVNEVIGVDLGTAPDKNNVATMPLYGAVQGGVVGFDITDVTEPIDAIDTPSWLSSVPDAYAVFVTGTSMAPRFNPREVVYVHPHRPYREGDCVVVQLAANGRTHAIVKQFVEITDTHVVLRQHNPDRELRHKLEDVSAIHTIVGSYYS